MEINNSIPLHPLLQKIIEQLEQTGAGEVVVAEDGHIFFQPCVAINHLWGAADMKREGREAGVHVIIRRVGKRGKRCKYAGLPWFQIYVLPIVKKNAQTMTANERRNMELNAQALRMAHAVERDPEQAALWHERHEAHKLNPQGYKKLYANFFGFLVATFRMELAKQSNPQTTARQVNPMRSEMSDEPQAGIRLCVQQTRKISSRPLRPAFRPFIRLPMVA